MAVGPGPLDELFLHTEVNKALVYHPVRSLQSQLPSLCHSKARVRHQVADNYTASSGTRGSAS